ncbi:MAG: hypothetical protein ABW217_22445 [Polyangiaceae bacterium]
MSPQDAEALQDFSRWLSGLAADARALSKLVVDPAQPSEVRAYATGALGAVLHASDVVCDGVEDLAWIDVALFLRIAARRTPLGEPAPEEGGQASVIARLAAEAEAAARFLGDLGPAYEQGIEGRLAKAVRGRGVDGTLAELELGAALAVDIATWAADFTPPALTQDQYELVKLRTFLRARAA